MFVNDNILNNKHRLALILEQDDVFKAFDQHAQQLLLGQVSFRRFLSGQLILGHQQTVNEIYVLLNGSLQVGWLQPNGHLKVANYTTNYSAFNLVSFLQKKPANYDFFAVGQVDVAVLSGQVFLQQLQQQPQAMWQILQLISQRMYSLFEQSRYTHTANSTQHIAYYLDQLAREYGKENNNHCWIGLRMTQQNFAELFGISRQTLAKNLQPFLKQGILEWNYSQIHILDIQRLRQLCRLE